MKRFTEFIEHLKLFESGEKGRQKVADKLNAIRKSKLNTAEGRKEYSDIIAECFIPCAKKILAGYFKVTNDVGNEVLIRKIQPTVLELYYHEEGPGRFKDPIMYHTNDRKNYEFYKDKYEELKEQKDRQNYFEKRGIDTLPYYPIGSLNPHTSGIDVTFENAQEKYRASFLIRAYSVTYENEKTRTVDNSTEIYDDLLLNGISLDNADWIEWVDGKEDAQLNERSWRRNVPDYEKVSFSPELWVKKKATEGDTFSIGGVRYAKCPLKWQFSTKK